MKNTFYYFNLCISAVCLLPPLQAFAQLTATGQLRTRTELLSGQGTPLSKGDHPAFFTSQRTRLNVGYKAYRTELYVSVQDVRVWGQDASTNNRITNAPQNGLMLHEAWGEISLLDTSKTKTGKELSLKIGRQELTYDDSRLLGNLDWLQQARRHDAALIKYRNAGFMLNAGAAYNQNRELKSGTLYDGIPVGYGAGTNGIGTMYKSLQFLYLGKKLKGGSASFLIIKDDFQKYTRNETAVRTLQKGTWNRLTLGPYFQSKLGKSWNFTTSGYIQTGKDKDGVSLNAYMYSVKGLYQVNGLFSAGPGFDFTSGTRAKSTKNQTFDPLYGTPHKFWGQMDYFYVANGFGQGGLSDLYITSNTKVSDKLSIQTDLHHFSSATPIRNALDEDRSGNLGNELDIIATYNLTKAISFQGGYCTYLTTNSLAQLKGISNPQKMANWAYLMINIKPEFRKL